MSLVKSNDFNKVKFAIKQSMDLVNFDFDRKCKNIVIKPNLCYYYHPSTGEVVDPLFVEALIEVLRDNLAQVSEISVVESDASAMKCEHSFRMLGYDVMAKKMAVKLVNLSEQKYRVIEHNFDGSSFTFHIPELFYEADLVINVPKIKYMYGVKMTCALKNFFGCNAYQKKLIYHKILDEAIVFLNKEIKTDLVVVDGLVVCGKYTKQIGLVMSGEDPVAIDSAAATLMGINPNAVKQISLASQEGLGTSEFSPVGDYSYFKKVYPKKRFNDKLKEKAASVYFRVFS